MILLLVLCGVVAKAFFLLSLDIYFSKITTVCAQKISFKVNLPSHLSSRSFYYGEILLMKETNGNDAVQSLQSTKNEVEYANQIATVSLERMEGSDKSE